jgi:hypothetical protein
MAQGSLTPFGCEDPFPDPAYVVCHTLLGSILIDEAPLNKVGFALIDGLSSGEHGKVYPGLKI